MKVAIVDTGVSNLTSVERLISSSKASSVRVEEWDDLDGATHMVIPGVGSFLSAMAYLKASQMTEAIISWALSGRPILGICLGMQLLGEYSEESPSIKGLGILPVSSRKLTAEFGFSVPHAGWNNVRPTRSHPVLDGLRLSSDFYFSHSFAVAACPHEFAIAVTQHGDDFISIVGKANILGVQFHPELSHKAGEKLFSSFLKWDGNC